MFERVVRAHAGDAEQARRIVENRFYRNIADALSGTQEYMASEALYELHGDPRFDLVVVDTPPSRNALDFLDAPGVLTRFLDHPRVQAADDAHAHGLQGVVGRQPTAAARDRTRGGLGRARRHRRVLPGVRRDGGGVPRPGRGGDRAAPRTRSTRFVLVTAPQRETITEAAWFADQLHEQRFGVAATIVNRMHPRFGSGSAADASTKAAAAPVGSDVGGAVGEPGRAAHDRRGRARGARPARRPGRRGVARRDPAAARRDVHDLAALTTSATSPLPTLTTEWSDGSGGGGGAGHDRDGFAHRVRLRASPPRRGGRGAGCGCGRPPRTRAACCG